MSTLNVDKVDPSSGTALEIGSSGDTVTVPSGATFAVSGTMNASSITAGTLAVARGGTGTTSYSPGITEYDMWRLTTSFTGNAGTGIASNLERNDNADFEKIGTGMSESSGVFTFPSTGKWQLMFNVTTQANVATADNFSVYILTTLNNSDYSERSAANIGQTSEGSSGFRNAQVINLFDVTDVSNCKCKFGVNDITGSNTQTDGDSGKNYTYMSFIRIGDT